MLIESVAAATAAISTINNLVKQVNETGSGVQQVMGMISDFGEGLTEFELNRTSSTFKPLTQSELFTITRLRKQQERYWKDLSDLLVALDPELLEEFKRAKAEQEHRRKEHMALMAKKKKDRERLIQQLMAGGVTLVVGGGIAFGLFLLVIKAFT